MNNSRKKRLRWSSFIKSNTIISLLQVWLEQGSYDEGYRMDLILAIRIRRVGLRSIIVMPIIGNKALD